MTDISILLFAGVLLFIVGVSLKRREGIYEYPFLAAMVFAGFILVQAVGLRNDPELPPGSLAMVMVMSTLCALGCYFGFKWGGRKMPILNWAYDEKRLLRAAFILVAVGVLFWVLIARLPQEETNMTQWTGRPVAYLFFAQCDSYGLAIALLLFLRTGRKIALIPIGAGVLLYADLAVMSVKRGISCELALMILLAVWYVKRKCLPKIVLFSLVAIATLAIYSIGDLRAMIKGDKDYASALKGDSIPSLADLSKLSPLERANDVIKNGAPEVRNAAHVLSAVSDEQDFDFGLNDWNTVIFRYVPAQVVGESIKNALMIPLNSPLAGGVIAGYQPTPGSTFTGMADAFGSFWYFGFVKFIFIGWVLGTLNNCALKGNIAAAVMYMVLITEGLESITHNTQYFLCRMIHAGIFALPAFWYARIPGYSLSVAPSPSSSQESSGARENGKAPGLCFRRPGAVTMVAEMRRRNSALWRRWPKRKQTFCRG